MSGRRIVARIVSLLAALALVAAVMPNFQFQTGVDVQSEELLEHLQQHPEQIPSRHHITLGLGFSPLFEYLAVTELEVTKETHHFHASRRFNVGWFSWSAMLLVISLILFRFRARARWFQAAA